MILQESWLILGPLRTFPFTDGESMDTTTLLIIIIVLLILDGGWYGRGRWY
jgi:hypothetical protein